MFTTDTVTVITPATGHRHLARCAESVGRQTFPRVTHLIVVDGPEHAAKVSWMLDGLGAERHAASVLVLPQATGRERWLGHRIYAAGSFLVNSEFVAFLDEDNWLAPDHFTSLVAALRAAAAPWAFALRMLMDGEGRPIAADECESLGNLHPVFNNPRDFLVDTNCYLLPRQLAARHAHLWYQRARLPGVLDVDRRLCQALLRDFPGPACNRRPTVFYTVGNRSDSVQADFFLKGNAWMRQRYPKGMPWMAAKDPSEQ